MSVVGARIRQLREAQHLSQAELATRTRAVSPPGVSDTYIGNLERGQARRPGHGALLSIARALGYVTVDTMLGEGTPAAVVTDELRRLQSSIDTLLEGASDDPLERQVITDARPLIEHLKTIDPSERRRTVRAMLRFAQALEDNNGTYPPHPQAPTEPR